VRITGGPAIGTAVTLEFRLPDASVGIAVRARGVVVRRVEEEIGSYRVPGVAVRFTDLDPEGRSRIEAFVRGVPAPAPAA
jgi:hypothetical protein